MRGLLVALALLVAACGGGSETGPPDIEYGRDVCIDCNMIINEPRFAAAYRDEGGDEALFDDIGDLLRYAGARGVLDFVDPWVHDYNTEQWIDAPEAWFVHADIETPMGSGLVAFADEDDARAFAEERSGEVLAWDDLVARAGTGGTVP